MKKIIKILTLILTLGVCAFGCAGVEERPAYDQVHLYPKPFDYTYLKVIEAVNGLPNWMLEETDKEKGILIYRNIQYGHLFDYDKQTARIIVSRVGVNQTSVKLDPSTQKIEDAPKMFERIDALMVQSSLANQQPRTSAPVPAPKPAA